MEAFVSAYQSLPDPDRLNGFRNVVHAQDRGTPRQSEQAGGQRAWQAAARILLARKPPPRNDFRDTPTRIGRAERAKLGQPAQQLHGLFGGLGEADAGIDRDPVPGDAGAFGGRDPLAKLPRHVGRNVVVAGLGVHVGRRAAHVHQHDRAAAGGNQRRRLRVVAQAHRRR